MRRRMSFVILGLATALLTWSPAAVGAAPTPPSPPAVTTAVPAGAGFLPTDAPHPKSDIVVDAYDGRILMGDNIHDALHPASTVKLFTALAAVERLAPRAPVTADPTAAAVEENRIGFTAGTTWPLNDMLAALMMVSANDAAYSIAHTVGGSLDGFATDLNELAKRLGAQNSILGDPAGLDDTTSYKGGPYTSAFDLSIAARNALTIPAIASWASMPSYQFTDPQGAPHTLENHNKMIQQGSPYFYFGGTGFKTGFTQQAQHTLVATATRNGRTLIVVIMGAVTPGYAEAKALLDAGFATNPDASTPPAGAALPPTAVSLYSTRAGDRDAFAKLGDAPAASATAGVANVASDVPATFKLSQPPRAAAPVVAAKPTKHSSSLLSLRNFLIVLILLGIVAFFLRRRAVRRQRARRLARRKQRLAAMRSGGLPVVDGRYRPGTRLGQPLESHVRVRRVDDPTSAIEADLDELRALDA